MPKRAFVTYACGHQAPVPGDDRVSDAPCSACWLETLANYCALHSHVNVAPQAEACPCCGKVVPPGELHR